METATDRVVKVDSDRNVHEVIKHVVSLDGVRGTAILLVVLHHLLWAKSTSSYRILSLILQLRGAGWVGVDLFFALSGFLITGILYSSLRDRRFFRNFYARRMFRIFPLYYSVVIVLAVIFFLRGSAQDLHLVWPVVVFLVKDRRKLMGIAACLVVLAPVVRVALLAHGSSFDEVYRYTICRADSLLAGAWLALAVRGPMRDRIFRAAAPCFWIALVICCGIGAMTGNFDWETNYTVNAYGYSAVSLASVAIIAMALQAGSIVDTVMRAGWLRFLGRYSYGIYVYHVIVAEIVSQAIAPHIHSSGLYRVVFVVLAASLSILISVLSFNYFEKPFLSMKRFFNYDRSAAPQTTT